MSRVWAWMTDLVRNFMAPNIALKPIQDFPIITVPDTAKRSHVSHERGESVHKFKPPLGAFDLSIAQSFEPPPPSLPRTQMANKTFAVRAMIDTTILDKNRPLAILNDTSYAPQSPPLISLQPSQYNNHQLVPSTGLEPVWVDVVVNNHDIAGHPFHLHGHDFYVLQSCHKILYKMYNPAQPGSLPPCGEYNFERPTRKDTVYVPGGGYTVLRFYADNRGIWMFHCHLLWHHMAGMAMGFRALNN